MDLLLLLFLLLLLVTRRAYFDFSMCKGIAKKKKNWPSKKKTNQKASKKFSCTNMLFKFY